MSPVDSVRFDDDLSSIDPYIAEQYRAALETRDRAPHRTHLESAVSRFAGASLEVRLEIVGFEYHVVLIAVQEDGVPIITNLSPSTIPTRPFAGRLGDLVEYLLPESAAPPRFADNLARLHFDDGLGGDADTLDGMVFFLRIRTPTAVRETHLYGHTYEAFHGSWHRPADPTDGPRWDAITAVLATWRELMRAGPQIVQTLAPAAPP